MSTKASHWQQYCTKQCEIQHSLYNPNIGDGHFPGRTRPCDTARSGSVPGSVPDSVPGSVPGPVPGLAPGTATGTATGSVSGSVPHSVLDPVPGSASDPASDPAFDLASDLASAVGSGPHVPLYIGGHPPSGAPGNCLCVRPFAAHNPGHPVGDQDASRIPGISRSLGALSRTFCVSDPPVAEVGCKKARHGFSRSTWCGYIWTDWYGFLSADVVLLFGRLKSIDCG
ncbi:hypothetical protein M8818_001547 [Zalaria obscura]|uniref:Uncharacterized protein n=1 Tax=Zalaria obscura TaxID=2024903 RepID=A0ACC3SK25_9PEZI